MAKRASNDTKEQHTLWRELYQKIGIGSLMYHQYESENFLIINSVMYCLQLSRSYFLQAELQNIQFQFCDSSKCIVAIYQSFKSVKTPKRNIFKIASYCAVTI